MSAFLTLFALVIERVDHVDTNDDLFARDRVRRTSEGAAMRMQSLLLVLLMACAGNDDAPPVTSQSPCEQVRDHMIELRLASADKIDRAAHREVMRKALGDDFVASCREKMTDTEVQCALQARDSLSAMACSTKAGAR